MSENSFFLTKLDTKQKPFFRRTFMIFSEKISNLLKKEWTSSDPFGSGLAIKVWVVIDNFQVKQEFVNLKLNLKKKLKGIKLGWFRACIQNKLALLHFRTPPFVIDDSSWKNAAESFTIALTLTLGGYESAIAPINWLVIFLLF